MEKIHVIVTGKVQGVGFRYAAAQMAREIGLSGWVRNLPDGRVECEAVGPKEGIEEFLEWLSKGPTTAKVTELQLVVREKAGAQPAEAVAFSIK